MLRPISTLMAPTSFSDNYSVYLWRSPKAPGTLYLARNLDVAEALCRGLSEDGYIVKVVHTATNTEFEFSGGKLCPAHDSEALPQQV